MRKLIVMLSLSCATAACGASDAGQSAPSSPGTLSETTTAAESTMTTSTADHDGSAADHDGSARGAGNLPADRGQHLERGGTSRGGAAECAFLVAGGRHPRSIGVDLVGGITGRPVH